MLSAANASKRGIATNLIKDNTVGRDITIGDRITNIYNNLQAKELAIWGVAIGAGAFAAYQLYQWWTQPEKPLAENPQSQRILIDILRASYEKKRIARLFTKPKDGEVFDSLYTRLALVREDEVKKDRDELKEEFNLRLSKLEGQAYLDMQHRLEHIHLCDHLVYTKREPIDESKLFEVDPAKDSKEVTEKKKIDRILIQGQAGIGKSTFCYHYARKLMEEDKDRLIFIVPLRNLLSQTEVLNDAKVLQKVIPDIFGRYSEDELKIFLEAKVDSIYWILDGYDEVANIKAEHLLKQWLFNIAFKKDRVLLTTRPLNIAEFIQDRDIEMTGFSNEDIYGIDSAGEKKAGYIDRYFDNAVKKKEFELFLKSQAQLAGMTRIPVVLELMCYAWDNYLSQKEASSIASLSLTGLYSSIYKSLCRRYLEKAPTDLIIKDLSTKEILNEIDKREITLVLNTIAYERFKANQFIFQGKNILSCFPDSMPASRRKTVLHEFGLIRCIEEKGDVDETEHSFQHLTLQEYLTARAWIDKFSNKDETTKTEAIQVFKDNKYNKRYELVWGFVGGLLAEQDKKDKSAYVHNFLELVDQAPREMIGVRHLTLVIQVVGEADCLTEGSREHTLICEWLSDEIIREIDIDSYAAMLGRYPDLIYKHLASVFEQLYLNRENWYFAIQLLQHNAKLEKAKLLVNTVISALKDSNSNVRYSFARVLGNIGPKSGEQLPEVIAALRNVLKDSNEDMRHAAAEVLGNIGPKSGEQLPEVIAALRGALKDSNEYVRSAAAEALITIGQAAGKQLPEIIAALRDTLKDSSEYVRRNVAKALVKIGQAAGEQLPEVIAALLSALKDSDLSVRRDAAEALVNIGQVAGEQLPEVIAALLDALKDSASDMRRAAAVVLGNIGQAASKQLPEIIAALRGALKDSEWFVRCYAAYALGEIGQAVGEQRSEIIAALLSALKDSNGLVRRGVAKALGNIGQAAGEQLPEIIAALLSALNDSDCDVRHAAVDALGKIGQKSGEQLPEVVIAALLSALKDSDLSVRRAAAEALVNIGQKLGERQPEVTAALLSALKDSNSGVRSSSAEALGKIGQVAGEQLPEIIAALLSALKDSNEFVRRDVAEALGKIGQRAGKQLPEVITALRDALKDSESYVRRAAAETLGKIGQRAGEQLPEVIAALRGALKDSNEYVRRAAAEALGNIGQAAGKQLPEVIATLRDALKDSNESMRCAAAVALGNIGQKSGEQLPEVIAALRDALNDSDSGVRHDAISALQKIDKSCISLRPAVAENNVMATPFHSVHSTRTSTASSRIDYPETEEGTGRRFFYEGAGVGRIKVYEDLGEETVLA
ncbi:MAG: HEAT repeat domain-containing protein [Gammaproteobacteria bacterium]|nr:HEAT repeat domain-containing protein [Gammaproteobacteria bacterium]